MLQTETIRPDSNLQTILDNIEWQAKIPPTVRLAPPIGWLVTMGQSGQVSGLVGFSTEKVQYSPDVLLSPLNMADVQDRVGRPGLGWLNNDFTAKGLGSVMANLPTALDPRSLKHGAAVRSVPLTNATHLIQRDRHDSRPYQWLRIARHGLLLLGATALDRAGRYPITDGTVRAMRFMERNYGDARLVRMHAPPIWQRRQRKEHIEHPLPPQIVLVRGGEFATSNPMQTLGHFPNRQ